MFLLREMMPAALLAFACGVVLLLLLRAVPAVGWRRRLAPSALALAYLAGSWMLEGRPKLPPPESLGWLVPMAFGAAVIGMLGWPLPAGSPMAVAVMGGAVAAVLGLSGSLRMAEIASVAIATAAAGVLFCRGRGLGMALLVPAVVLVALGHFGYKLAEVPQISACLLVLGLILACTPLGKPLAGWKEIARQVGAAVVLGGIAVVIAYRASPALDY